MQLYGYFRSSAAYRVRIALNLKGFDYARLPVDLPGSAHRQDDYLAVNPQGLVPALLDGGRTVIQSLAAIEYLEETRPDPPLLPADPGGRARVRAMAQIIACDIHPLNNLRVLKYLENRLGHDETARNAWYRHWIAEGFEALERMLAERAAPGRFCHGDDPGMADVCLVPQVFNALRFSCPTGAYPALMAVYEACEALPAFADAHPSRQPDAR